MRVASIICSDFIHLRAQIALALPNADSIELRLDYFASLDLAALTQLRQELVLPVIFTLRKKAHGGYCQLKEPERLQLIEQLAHLTPDYIDIEYDTEPQWIALLKAQHPAIKIIGSYHNFDQTPLDLNSLFHSIYQPIFDIVKIATFATTICDTLRLLIFIRAISPAYTVIGIAMGEAGEASRLLAPIVGSVMTYGSVDSQSNTAPGQLSLAEMTSVYRVHLLNQNTAIYALLGCPVSQSPGHVFHNAAFRRLKKNAIYVKLKIEPDQLTEAVLLLKELKIAGGSVTIPHKETILPLLDTLIDEAAYIPAANTFKLAPILANAHFNVVDGDFNLLQTDITSQKNTSIYLGFNTDGTGTLDVLSEKIAIFRKKILILGAGGSAKAIAYTLYQAGAVLTISNRTLAHAQTLAQSYNGQVISFAALINQTHLSYDVILNTLPADAFYAQFIDWIIPITQNPQALAMDIVLKPLNTLFIKKATLAGYQCITGNKLYKKQARRQLQIWFD